MISNRQIRTNALNRAIIRLAVFDGKIRNRDLAEALDVSPMEAGRILHRRLKTGFVRRVAVGAYVLVESER